MLERYLIPCITELNTNLNCNEEWRIIHDFIEYAVSDSGRIKRIVRGSGTQIGKIIKPKINTNGYLYVCLSHNSIVINQYIHRLVISCFKRTMTIGEEGNHLDGNKFNNTPNNLEICSHVDNMKHAYSNGLIDHRGELASGVILTEHEAYLIKSMLCNTKYTQKEISDVFHVSRGTVNDIKRGRTWKHVGYPSKDTI